MAAGSLLQGVTAPTNKDAVLIKLLLVFMFVILLFFLYPPLIQGGGLFHQLSQFARDALESFPLRYSRLLPKPGLLWR